MATKVDMEKEKNKHLFLTEGAKWSNEFEISLNWVDKDLIKLIIEYLKISEKQFSRFLGPSKNWISRINKINNQTKKYFQVTYPNIREASDFLAVPPWLLFYRENKGPETEHFNEKVISLFKSISPQLPIYKIYAPHEDYKVNFFDHSEQEKDKAYRNLSKHFGKDEFSHETVLEGTWKGIFHFLEFKYQQNLEFDFSGSALIHLHARSRYIRLGTVRFRSKEHEAFETNEIRKYRKKSFWSTAWFTVELTKEELDKYDYIIESICNDISTLLFGRLPWKFQIQNGKKCIILYSWHSLRIVDNEELFIKIEEKIEDKLKDIRYPLELSVACRNSNEVIDNLTNVDQELLNQITTQLVKTISIDLKPNHSRRKNTLDLLHEKGIIEHGTKIVMKHKIKSDNIGDQKITYATIVIQNGTPKIKWDYDGEIYYITTLTQKIFREFDIEPLINQKNGNLFWGKVDDNVSLIDQLSIFKI